MTDQMVSGSPPSGADHADSTPPARNGAADHPHRGGVSSPPRPPAIVAVDPDGRIALADSGAEDLFGYSWDELAHRPLRDLVQEPAALPTDGPDPGHLPAEARAGVALACRRKDGSAFDAEISMTPLDSDGGPLVSVAIRELDAASAEADRAIEHATARAEWLSALIDHAHTPIVSADLDGTITSWNTPAERAYGYPAETMIGRPIASFVDPTDAERVQETLARVRAGETVHLAHGRVIRADGSPLTVAVVVSPIVGADGGVVGVAYTGRELTGRERAEAKFRWLLDATPLAIIGIDAEGRIRMENIEAQRLFGYGPEELIGRPVDILLPEALRDASTARLARYPRDREIRRLEAALQVTGRRRDGTEFPAEVSLSSVLTDEGRLIAATVQDISARLAGETERARLEQELQRAQRLESLGQLAGGVAHDFDTLLAIVLSHSALLREDLDELRGDVGAVGDAVAGDPRLDEALRALEQIQQAAERGARLARQLLAFGRRDVLRPQTLDLNEVVDESRRLLSGTLGASVHVVTTTAAPSPSSGTGLWPMVADPGRIEQALVNLAANARDAMPEGGTIEIATENVALDTAQAAQYGVPAGRYVRLSVSDTGTGMPPEVAERAFEPFFTTKPDGQGTGMGLASVYGIVAQAAGTVSLRSQPGRGSTVTMLFPAADVPSAARGPAAEPGAGIGAGAGVGEPPPTAVVLVVEEEPDLRHSIEIILGREGYAVLTAGSATEALTVADAYEGEIDLLLIDVTMPDLSGREVAERIREARPSTRVLYLSTFAPPVPATDGSLDPDVELVEKPFTRSGLLGRVAQVLTD